MATKKPNKIAIKDKIRHTLEETRVVLPGTQTLLGFQLIAVFDSFFEKLPILVKHLHLLSLLLICISIIALLSSVSFHRIVEKGNDTHRLHNHASHMLLVGMIFLLAGMSVDLYIVILLITGSYIISIGATSCIILFALALWFMYPVIRKETKKKA